MKDYKSTSDYQAVMARADRIRTIRDVVIASLLTAGFAVLGVIVMAAF